MPEKTETATETLTTTGTATATPPTGTIPPSGAPQITSPATTEAVPEGNIERARSNVMIAIALLEQSLAHLGSGTEEGAAVLRALSSLRRAFGKRAEAELTPAEMRLLMSQMPAISPQVPPAMEAALRAMP